jgi:DNA-directed RNA polymerase specialized sigma24 family protein
VSHGRRIALSERWRRERRETPGENLLNEPLEGSDPPSGRERASGPPVNKEDRRAFNEMFLPHMAEAFRLAVWLTGNASDAEDVVQHAALRAFRGIRNFSAVNARAWSLTIVRNTAFNWLSKNRPKVVVFTDDLSPGEKHQLEHENALATRVETPEQIALFKGRLPCAARLLSDWRPRGRCGPNSGCNTRL